MNLSSVLKSALVVCFLFFQAKLFSQNAPLTIDRIFASREFQQDYMSPIQWIQAGEAYLMVEYNDKGQNELIKYQTSTSGAEPYLTAQQLTPPDDTQTLEIESFTLSKDESKVLIFTNSARVWRSNTRGDYWVYDFNDGQLKQLGKSFPPSTLMFAKFSADNRSVSYVMDFNLYLEDFVSGTIKQLTTDGNREVINGTFDWVYEEEFGCRDGFRWSPDGSQIAYWQLDASKTGNYNMINYTDSIYSQVIPIQYPKVGQDPSSARIGIVNTTTSQTNWIELPGSSIQNYLPAIQWIHKDLLLIQQLNRKQNHLKVWGWQPSDQTLRLIYEEQEESWVDIQYPDVTSSNWGDNDLMVINEGKSVLRMTEDDWRNVYRIDLLTGDKKMITPGAYDVASVAGKSNQSLYYMASPDNPTQRYLYSVDLNGKQKDSRITPEKFAGINTYDISPNGKYAIHSYRSSLQPTQVQIVSLPTHRSLRTLVTNNELTQKLESLELPNVLFTSVITPDNIPIDARILQPKNFDTNKKYPVIFHVYGEPWGQVAQDSWIGMWNILLTQLGYVVIDIDPRGTPTLKGSEWRKSIYRQVGRVNAQDMGQAAKKLIELPYIDEDRVGVWGWSGGGSSTLNLMFRFPEVFKTGVAVAFVANQLTYDNIYQERYMGLPQENLEDFIVGSPISYAKNLQGDLLLIHGTGDDNVHYQNMEMLINELIKQNKQFDMMSYPNRSHGIYEGANTTRHLYTLISNYFLEKIPVN